MIWHINSLNADGHRIYISTDGVTYTNAKEVVQGISNIDISGLTADTTYYFKIVAFKSLIESLFSNIVSEKTISILLYDEFTTSEAAPIATPRTSKPTGSLAVSDAGNIISITDNKLVISGSASGNTGISGSSTTARVAGLTMQTIIYSVTDTGFGRIGLASSFGSDTKHGLRLDSTTAIKPAEELALISTTFPNIFYVVCRSTGSFLIRGSKLIWASRTGNTTPLMPNAWWGSTQTPNLKLSTLRMVKIPKLGIDANLYTFYKATPVNNDIAVQESDALINFTWNPASSETMELMFRRTDDNNTMILRASQSGSTVKLIKKIEGVETEVYSIAQTYTVGTNYRHTIWMEGSVIWAWVDLTRINTFATGNTFNTTATGVKVTGFTTGSDLYVWKEDLTSLIPKGIVTYGTPRYYLAVGDSKSLPTTWTPQFETLVDTFDNDWTVSSPNFASVGRTVAVAKSLVDAYLAALSATPAPEHIMCNLGTNDVGGDAGDVLSDGTGDLWKSNYLYIIDALHTKYPSAKIYLMKPWKPDVSGSDYTAKLNLIGDTLITDIITARSTFVYLGGDERIFLENGDNGATYIKPLPDGVHPNAAGYAITAATWKTAVGL